MTLSVFGALQLVMFSGKGGVGKTTLSCGMARGLAQQWPEETTLLISTDPAHSLGDVLQIPVMDTPQCLRDLPNLQVRALDAKALLQRFRADYGDVLELLVERGSFVEGDDLSPVWDMGWPGLDELMGILEIQRILRSHLADRVVVDMAPSGHTLNLFGLMDFLDTFLEALEQFQAKHRFMTTALARRYTPDEADAFLHDMKQDLVDGRALLQNATRTACWVVAIAEPMSLLESQRFTHALAELHIPLGGIIVNRLDPQSCDSTLLSAFQTLADLQPVLGMPLQTQEPIGSEALDILIQQIRPLDQTSGLGGSPASAPLQWPEAIAPGLPDFLQQGRRLLVVGGKGGVGKTTVSAAVSWGLAQRHPTQKLRVISIDPAHSLGDAFGQPLGHTPVDLTPNLSAQEVDAAIVLDNFRDEYLWELAEMMSGGEDLGGGLTVAYGPQAWRQMVAQALPGIDEMLSLIAVMDLLERNDQDLIVLDTAPTGHLLRFLEMPAALSDWLAWIFKLWMKYQDVVGRVELIGRLRTLRQRVMKAQKLLKDPQHTEFIGVVQHQSAILAEASRLSQTLGQMGISQRYLIHNRYQAGEEVNATDFPHLTIVRLPALPTIATPFEQVQAAANLLM